MSASEEQQISLRHGNASSQTFRSSSPVDAAWVSSSNAASDATATSVSEEFGWVSPSQMQQEIHEQNRASGDTRKMIFSQLDAVPVEQTHLGGAGWASPSQTAAKPASLSASDDKGPQTPRIQSLETNNDETEGVDSPNLHIKAYQKSLANVMSLPHSNVPETSDHRADGDSINTNRSTHIGLGIIAGRTLRFAEILALPGYEAGKLRPTPAAATPPLPKPEPRNPDRLLRDIRLGDCNPPSDLDVAVCLITMGTVVDPSPHYQWMESDKIIQWFMMVLTSKLNYLLELDASKRETKARLLKGVQPIPADVTDLVMWARTGTRKNIRFRYYDDWVARLQNFHQHGDLTIYEYMVLITGLYHKLAADLGAFADAATPGQPSATAHPSFLADRLVPWQPLQPSLSKYCAQAARAIVPPQAVWQSSQQFSPRRFEVYRDQQAIHSSHEISDQNDILQDQTNIAIQENLTGHKRKASHDPLEAGRVPKSSRHEGTQPSSQGMPETVKWNDLSRNIAPSILEDLWPEINEEEVTQVALSSSQDLHNLRNIDEGAPGDDDLFGNLQALCGEGQDATPIGMVHLVQHSGDDDLQLEADPKTDEVQRLANYLRTSQSVPEREYTNHGTATAGTLVRSQPHASITNAWLNDEVASFWQLPPLFRLMPYPNDHEDSLLARCIRFATSAEQRELDWRIHGSHITEILNSTDWYGGELFEGRE